jgi:hypothetical protein
MNPHIIRALVALVLSASGLALSAAPASAATKHKTTTTTSKPLTPFCRDLHTAAKYQAKTLPNPLSPHAPTAKELTKALNNEAAAFSAAANLAPTAKSSGQLTTTAKWLRAAATVPKADSLDIKKANAAFLAFTSTPKAATWCSGY